ncbi:MAG: divergent polysaccharide deacetylase family protein, partial [Candidatus Eremiobacteraeota bacterium]|nr:divergent polysaccharide deacetylase family protein [Candidatus Eremiobacteraeota bacterium]
IAIGHPRAATLAALQTMVPELQNDGVDFTLVQDLVNP